MSRPHEKNSYNILCIKKAKRVQHSGNLYISPLFKYNLKYAKKLTPDKILILSAKYGVVEPDQIIEPCDATLNNMKSDDVKAWAINVINQLKIHADIKNDEFTFLAGEKYRKYLLEDLPNHIIQFEGLKIGHQLQELKGLTE